jgi:hypothetical protein
MSQKIELQRIRKIKNVVDRLKQQYPILTRDNIKILMTALDTTNQDLHTLFGQEPTELQLLDSIKDVPEVKHLFLYEGIGVPSAQGSKSIRKPLHPTIHTLKLDKINNVARRLQEPYQPLTREKNIFLMDLLTTINRDLNKLFGREPTEQELFDSIKDMPEVKHLFPYECFLHNPLCGALDHTFNPYVIIYFIIYKINNYNLYLTISR